MPAGKWGKQIASNMLGENYVNAQCKTNLATWQQAQSTELWAK